MEMAKINKNDSTPRKELLLLVLLIQFHKIIFAFHCLVLCFELCVWKADFMKIRYVPSPRKCLYHLCRQE